MPPAKLMTDHSTSDDRPHQPAASAMVHNSEAAELGVITVDVQTRIVGMNPTVSDVLARDVGEYLHRPLADFMVDIFAEADAKRVTEAARQAQLTGQISAFEFQLPDDDIPLVYVKVHISPIDVKDATDPIAVLTLEDITPYKRAGLTGAAHEDAHRYAEAVQLTARLERQKEMYRLQSIHDGLTGLYNFAHFHVLLADEVARARRYGHALSLLMIDIDNFKAYNDSYGHPAGNWAIRGVATILQQASRHTDRVARYGGEEFSVILPETSAEEAFVVAHRLRDAVEHESRVGVGLGFRRVITVSIGVAGYPGDADSPHELVLKADKRLYRAKSAGKNEVCWEDEPPASK